MQRRLKCAKCLVKMDIPDCSDYAFIMIVNTEGWKGQHDGTWLCNECKRDGRRAYEPEERRQVLAKPMPPLREVVQTVEDGMLRDGIAGSTVPRV